MRELLRSVVATLVSPRGRRLAGWAARAVGRLPNEAKISEEAQMLAFGASLRLGDIAVGNISAGRAAEWGAWLSPDDLETVAVGVALLEEAVEFAPLGRTLSHRIELPKTTPVMVELGWSDGTQERSERVILDPHDVTIVQVGPEVTQVDIRTVLGDSYTLTVPEPRERRSPQKKIARVRPPRVRITYDVQVGDAIEVKQLPFVVGVLADLSGQQETPLAELKARRFVETTPDNFEAVLAAMNPRLSLRVVNAFDEDGGQILIALSFQRMADFEPTHVAHQVEQLHSLLEARTRLGEFQSLLRKDEKLQFTVREALVSSGSSQVFQTSESEGHSQFDRISRVLEVAGFERARVKEFVTAFVERVDLPSAASDLDSAISYAVARIDSQLSQQLRLILHHPQFQALESTWRGLYYLLRQTEVSESLKIRVLNVRKSELFDDLASAPEFRESVAFRKIYEETNGVFGGEPFGLLVGAYEFGESDEDMEMLQNLSQIAAASCAPLLAAAAPGILKLDSFATSGSVTDLYQIFQSPESSRWRQFRESEESRYVGLTLPHVLLRIPYGKNTTPVEEFDFEEFPEGSDLSKRLWGNAAFTLATCVTRAFAHYGWCAAIRGVEGGGLVEGLPTYTFSAQDGDVLLGGPTEVAITARNEKELSDMGFIPLVQLKSTDDKAAFFSANSVYRPPQYESTEAHEASLVSAQLPYTFAVSRFAHYLLCMMRDKIGSFMHRDQCELFLNKWIASYVLSDDNAGQEMKAKFPLQEARIEVTEVENKPGSYIATAYLRPHFQLEEIGVSLRCAVLLPNEVR